MRYLGGSGYNLCAGSYYSEINRKGDMVCVVDDNEEYCWVSDCFFA